MLNFYQLQTFVTVLNEGSMTAAADKLYLTQPAVSQQIKSLEDELGVELLVRGVRHIKPTIQGELLLESAKKILQMVQQVQVAVKSMGAELKGTLRVGSLNSIGLHLMSGVLSKILKYSPNMQFKLEYNKAEELVKSFKRGQLDVLIVPDLEQEYNVTAEEADVRFLQKEEMWLVGSGKELDIPKQISLKQLNTLPVIQFTGEFPHFNDQLKKELQSRGQECRGVFETSNVGTLKRVIESGLGWGFLPAHSIRKQVKLGRLTRVHIDDFQYSVNLNFYAHKGSQVKNLVDVFFNALQSPDRG